ncbi:MAG: HEPN domain-containing protein [Candidatus Aenigmarchaeota archaeon]|nr:HEPN domain-containing protein [Candidatus Aenigmarchaeota archaeon]
MEMNNVKDCFEKRLLREISPDLERSKKSIETSERKLKKAEAAFEKEMFDIVIIRSYECMFHAARALLFKDGIVEKAHICVVLYLQKYYTELGKLEQRFINILNNLRIIRHSEFYDLEEISYSIQDAEITIKDAEEFLNKIKSILKL